MTLFAWIPSIFWIGCLILILHIFFWVIYHNLLINSLKRSLDQTIDPQIFKLIISLVCAFRVFTFGTCEWDSFKLFSVGFRQPFPKIINLGLHILKQHLFLAYWNIWFILFRDFTKEERRNRPLVIYFIYIYFNYYS